jgi:hypothetical protein
VIKNRIGRYSGALQTTATILISSLVALAIMEAVLRIAGFNASPHGNEYALTEFDPVIGWVNRPNARAEFKKSEFNYLVEINSQGMRDREVKPKRTDEYRVIFLGDSFTWGWGVPYGERFTEIIEARNPRINALNCGVSGYSPLQYLLLSHTANCQAIPALRSSAILSFQKTIPRSCGPTV